MQRKHPEFFYRSMCTCLTCRVFVILGHRYCQKQKLRKCIAPPCPLPLSSHRLFTFRPEFYASQRGEQEHIVMNLTLSTRYMLYR